MRIGRWINVILAILLLNIVLVASCRQTTTQTVSVPVPTITASDANNLIAQNVGNQNFVILDVRPADDYTSRHIAGAIDISYESAQFKNDVTKLDRNKQYLVYCQTGVNSASRCPNNGRAWIQRCSRYYRRVCSMGSGRIYDLRMPGYGYQPVKPEAQRGVQSWREQK